MNIKKRVLVVDDNMSTLTAFDQSLKDTFELINATNGLMALNILNRQNIDLILLDLNLPLIDGQTLSQVLYKNPQWKKIPIIMISGYNMPTDDLTANVKGFLGKPVKKEELLYYIGKSLVKG